MHSFLYDLATDKNTGFLASLLKVFLLFFSYIYGLAVRGLIFWHRLHAYRLDCKLISIGNITWGGTGKTSLVEFIAKYLKQQGHSVAVVSRGYKKPGTEYRVQGTGYESMGDEPYMLKENLKDIPVVVDTDRIRAAGLAIRDYSADTVILDDGLQQWKIKKDLEVIVIDSTNPFGNQYMLPRGILREPLSSLKRADIFVLTKTNLNPDTQEIKDFLRSLNRQAEIFESIHFPVGFNSLKQGKELLGLEILKGKTAALFCGIGDPYSFENLVSGLGINIGLSFVFPDHHAYSEKDLENIVRQSEKKGIGVIVTSQKDAARLTQLSAGSWKLPIFVLRIELRFTKDGQKFLNRLLQLYSL